MSDSKQVPYKVDQWIVAQAIEVAETMWNPHFPREAKTAHLKLTLRALWFNGSKRGFEEGFQFGTFFGVGVGVIASVIFTAVIWRYFT